MTNIFTLARRAAPAFALLTIFSILPGPGYTLDVSAAGVQQPDANGCDEQCQQQLAEVREATAQYHQEGRAVEDGFAPSRHCRETPGVGSMGYHYLNLSRASNLEVDARRPELLLYEPLKDGRVRLAAVEYFVPLLVMGPRGPQLHFGPEPPAPETIINQAPELFGRKFDGPMAGHGPGEPWHYDMHVWLWRHNPDGMFAPNNPRISCAEAPQHSEGGQH